MTTIPNLPDNIYKLLLLVGFACMSFGWYQGHKDIENEFDKIDVLRAHLDTLTTQEYQSKFIEKRLVKNAELFAARHQVPNPITSSDSTITFDRTISGDKLELLVSDSVSKLWEEFQKNQLTYQLLVERKKMKEFEVNEASENTDYNFVFYIVLFFSGIPFIFIGVLGMVNQQFIQDRLITAQIEEKGRYYKYCQSCGKNFSSMRGKSKNIDGSPNNAFCSSCFENGVFVEPDLTAADFKNRSRREITKITDWWSRFRISSRLKSLERWSEDEYRS